MVSSIVDTLLCFYIQFFKFCVLFFAPSTLMAWLQFLPIDRYIWMHFEIKARLPVSHRPKKQWTELFVKNWSRDVNILYGRHFRWSACLKKMYLNIIFENPFFWKFIVNLSLLGQNFAINNILQSALKKLTLFNF